ncbi:hypothetical protein ACHAXR_010560, partial [Thalassiosira sp. AJA248-18]
QRIMKQQRHLLIGLLVANNISPSCSFDRPHQPQQSHHQQYSHQTDEQQTNENNINLLTYIESYLTPLETTVNQQLFLTQTYEVSKIYKFRDLLAALPIVYDGVGGTSLYLGESSMDLGWEYGLVNLAAFLAQCMKETIQYDACDENNWDFIDRQYPLANACGQLGQSYQDYQCPPGEEHMRCEVDPNMRIKATTHAHWYGAPPGLFCAPKSDLEFVGIWDYNYWCNNPWADPPETCSVYEGQKAGRFDNDEPVPSRSGRTDVEGCCWWGRGVIQTTGVCNFGKLNYYLGARAAAEGRDSKYPEIDFCKTPDKICSSDEHSELKWIAGFFYWMKDVQSYNKDGWYYKTELHKFVNSGMTDVGFIDAISGIVNRGCHNPPCATGDVDGLDDRRANFRSVLGVFGLPLHSSRPPSTLPPIPAPPALPAPSSSSPKETENPALISAFLQRLSSHRSILERKVLSYQALNGAMTPSDLYTFDTLMESVAYAFEVGHAGKRFYLGPPMTQSVEDAETTPDLRFGLVNIAAFLSQSQSEGIQANACDEYHSDSINGKFPVSNSCGQFGNDYQQYTCSSYADKGMECPVVANMKATAVASGKYEKSLYDYRPNFYCGPDEQYTGAYNPSTMFYESGPVANAAGRTDVSGCCFWGRGALMSKGVCMLGKLNYYLGKKAHDDGRVALFPEVDFCSNPEYICKSIESRPTIVWDIALFEWIERIETYDDGNFNYREKLHQFVEGGMKDISFINTVSKIVVEGSADTDGTIQARENIHNSKLPKYNAIPSSTVKRAASKKVLHDLDGNIDVAIVGSGIGALSNAAALARQGLKVAVFEQHQTVGGSTHTFEKEGFEFDVGVHYVGGFSSVICKMYDILSDGQLKWTKLDETYDVMYNAQTGERIEMTDDHKENRRRLTEHFDIDGKAWKKFEKACFWAKFWSFIMFQLKVYNPILLRFVWPLVAVPYRRYALRSSTEVLLEMGFSPDAAGALTYNWGDHGVPPFRCPFFLTALLDSHYCGGAYFPRGGSRSIAKTLTAAIERRGGHVFSLSPVEKILTKKNILQQYTAVGVRVRGVDIRVLKFVVSGAGFLKTFGIGSDAGTKPSLVDADAGAYQRKLMRNVKGEYAVTPGFSDLSLFIGLDRSDEDLKLPAQNIWHLRRSMVGIMIRRLWPC